MELRDYLRIVRQGWLLIVAIALVAVGAAASYSFLKAPEYRASAKVFVSVQSNDTVNDLVQGSTFTQNRVKSYAELVTTPAVLRPVIADLGIDATVGALAADVSATAPLDTSLIQIDAVSPQPQRAADLANAVSQSLAALVGEIEAPQAATGVSPVRITQVTDAAVPASPDSPNIPLNLALGALVGLALGLGIAVLRETLDTRVRGEHDVQAITDTPIVGGIAYDQKASERPLVVQEDPRSIRAESFRALRTNFQFLGNEQRRSFVFTSAVQGEGKTTTVANLAIALAAAGRQVVVVDADLRRPRLADILGLEGSAGLTDLLIGRGDLDDLIQPWGPGGLQVLPAGRIPPNPSELLGSVVMAELVSRLEERYEFVLFDAAPLLPVTDAAVLSSHVGGAVLVVASGRTRKAQLRATLGALENVDVSPAGIVLTMLPTRGPDAYGYGYGYGYTYEAEQDSALQSAPVLSPEIIPRPAEPAAAGGRAVGPRRGGAGQVAVDEPRATSPDATPDGQNPVSRGGATATDQPRRAKATAHTRTSASSADKTPTKPARRRPAAPRSAAARPAAAVDAAAESETAEGPGGEASQERPNVVALGSRGRSGGSERTSPRNGSQ